MSVYIISTDGATKPIHAHGITARVCMFHANEPLGHRQWQAKLGCGSFNNGSTRIVKAVIKATT